MPEGSRYIPVYIIFAGQKTAKRNLNRYPQCALGIEELAAFLNEEGKEVIFLGDGVPVYKEILKEILRIPYSFAPVECNRQRAASVAALGRICLREGRTVSADEFMPTYLRMSQAEREQKQAREAGMINKEAGRL